MATVKCPNCKGVGTLYTSHSFDCPQCRGRGWITEEEHRKEEERKQRITHRLNRERAVCIRLGTLTDAELDTLADTIKTVDNLCMMGVERSNITITITMETKTDGQPTDK